MKQFLFKIFSLKFLCLPLFLFVFGLFYTSVAKADYVYCQNNALSCSYSQAAQHAFPPFEPLYYSVRQDMLLVPASLTYQTPESFYIVIYVLTFSLIIFAVLNLYL